jgi:hypothetical protein
VTRLVVDANVCASAAIGLPESPSSRVLAAAEHGEFELVVCDRILAEFQRTLRGRYFEARVPAEEGTRLEGLLREPAVILPNPIESIRGEKPARRLPRGAGSRRTRRGDRDGRQGSARSRRARAAGDHAADGVRAVRPGLARRLRQPRRSRPPGRRKSDVASHPQSSKGSEAPPPYSAEGLSETIP